MMGQAEREVARAQESGIAGFAVTLKNPPFSVRLIDEKGISGNGDTVSNAAAQYTVTVRGKDGLQDIAQAGQARVMNLAMNALLYGVESGNENKSTLPTLAEWDALVAVIPLDAIDDVDANCSMTPAPSWRQPLVMNRHTSKHRSPQETIRQLQRVMVARKRVEAL